MFFSSLLYPWLSATGLLIFLFVLLPVLGIALRPLVSSLNISLAASYISVLILGAILVFISPYQASDLSISDSVEYVSAALSLVNKGDYALTVVDRILPPRYPPWFSTFFLAPVYAVVGGDPGNGTLIEFASVMLSLIAAFGIGFRLSGHVAAILAATCLLFTPGLRYFSAQIMSDVPALAITLWVLLLYLLIRAKEVTHVATYWAAGVLIAFAASLRAPCLSLLLPFLLTFIRKNDSGRNIFSRLLGLVAPSLVLLLATILYNFHIFGSFFRNGYNFWVALPYDFTSLTFSFSYLIKNINVAFQDAGLLFILLMLAGIPTLQTWARKKNSQDLLNPIYFRPTLTAIGLSAVPQIIFYLFYFYSSPRFYLSVTGSLIVVLGAAIGGLVQHLKIAELKVALFLLFCVLSVFVYRQYKPVTAPTKRIAAEAVATTTETDSFVISGLDPVYLGTMLQYLQPESKRTIMPISRRLEFASKAISLNRLTGQAPNLKTDWFKNDPNFLRNYILKNGGQEAVPMVALENLQLIEDWIRQGRVVYLEAGFLDEQEISLLNTRFKIIQEGRVFKLALNS